MKSKIPMKYDTLKIKLILFLNARFYFLGRGVNIGTWSSNKSETDYSLTSLDKNIGQKGDAAIQIWVYRQTNEGIEIKIEMRLRSSGEYETFFEGFIESMQDIKSLFRMLGIPNRTLE